MNEGKDYMNSQASKQVYSDMALSQVPRLLTCLDRSISSPAFGCFHRDYWLYKTSDFPDAVRQFGVISLALVYRFDFSGNRYFRQPRIREWAVAAMMYCTRIQHHDGTFDEFYPYERGWSGPTAFVTYALAESYLLLADEIAAGEAGKILECLRKASRALAKGDRENDLLANHHAMACLALWKAYRVLQEDSILQAYEKQWQSFLSYHHASEGWSLEYDGPDPGYLSATISFLAKIYKDNESAAIREVLDNSISFASHFVYPDGSFGGLAGSRNTQHFYPHGFELAGRNNPLASAVAQKMLRSLANGNLVPPAIMSDRYVFYRVPELLLSAIDTSERPANLPGLPYELDGYHHLFHECGIYVRSSENLYLVSNLVKGGMIQAFDRREGTLFLQDAGIIMEINGARSVTTQWTDKKFTYTAGVDSWKVNGAFHTIPQHQLFNPWKLVLFRLFSLLFAWSPCFSHRMKGAIRKWLILSKKGRAGVFERNFEWEADRLVITDEIRLRRKLKVKRLVIGGDFFTRYVPQSRFFQPGELKDFSWIAPQEELDRLNAGLHFYKTREYKF